MFAGASEPADEVEAADKQYLLLREYHAQGLAQSKISFWFSLIFAALASRSSLAQFSRCNPTYGFSIKDGPS